MVILRAHRGVDLLSTTGIRTTFSCLTGCEGRDHA